MTEIILISSDEEDTVIQKHPKDDETTIIVSDDEDSLNIPLVKVGTFIDNFLESLEKESEPAILEIVQNQQQTQNIYNEPFPITSTNINNNITEQINTITNKSEVRSLTDPTETTEKLTTEQINTITSKSEVRNLTDPTDTTENLTTNEISQPSTSQQSNLTDKEHESHVVLKSMAKEAPIPIITIRQLNSLEEHIELEKTIKEKIESLKIINIIESKLIKSFPTTVFQYKDSEFSLVQIDGTVTGINKNIGNKCAVNIDDSTAVICVVMDNSYEEVQYRQQVKNNVKLAESAPTLNNSEMDEIFKMSSEKFHQTQTLERENKFLATLALVISKNTDKKNEIQFPLVKDLKLGDAVTVIGRVVPNAGERFIYGYNLKRNLSYNGWRKKCKEYDLKCEIYI